MQCVNNLKQIGLALHNYHDVNGSFPMGAGSGMWDTNIYKAKQGWSIHAAILPQLGKMPTYVAVNFNYGVGDAVTLASNINNRTVYSTQIKVFLCPSDPDAGTTGLNSSSVARTITISGRWGPRPASWAPSPTRTSPASPPCRRPGSSPGSSRKRSPS